MKEQGVSKTRTTIAALCASAVIVTLGACTSYNPYTGQQEYDPGRTMAAVGTAAFVGSVAHANYNYRRYDYSYRRPHYHRHYHNRRHYRR